ncbi:TPA: ead/Ea22-like family protein [Klebsiella quasipneumoniae subsp. similipneumoniae]|nr:ead/Ea22-like family protein [Klebsiella quasipneumoniae subsp. similipneumoniae]
MTDAELAQTKELAFWMTERVFMNPISAKFLNEDWRKAFPDEVAVAERMKALVEALEKAQQERDEFRNRLKLERSILEDADKRIAELEDAEQKLCAANVTLDARAELAERQLQSRTVRLPKEHSATEFLFPVAVYSAQELTAALAAQGIKVEAE